MPLTGFEPEIPTTNRPQTHVTTGIGQLITLHLKSRATIMLALSVVQNCRKMDF